MTRSPDHDILARIVALLLGLAMLAERAASRPLAVRLATLWIVLPAQHAALTLLDVAADDADPRPSQPTPAPSETDDDIKTLLHLALSFRAIAALLLHACLNDRLPASHRPRHTIALSRTCPVGPSRLRILGWVGMVHDTS